MQRIALAFLVALTACGEHPAAEPPPSQPASAQPAAATTTTAAPAAKTSGVVVRDTDMEPPFLNVNEEANGTVTIAFAPEGEAKTTLRGTMRDTGKRKYAADGGPVIFEIKSDDDGFKLRTADGALRWKVKFKDGKIKISDNEQNANPFELKIRDGGRVKVVGPGEREIGEVENNNAQYTAGKKWFTVEGATPSAAAGVLLLQDIPPPQRYILFAELLSRKK